MPANVVVAAAGPNGAAADFTVTAFDVGGETLTPTLNDPSGSIFPIGTTTVTASATDALGNTAQASFDVTVEDTTPPTLTLPANVVVQATSAAGAQVTVPQATATDPVDPNPTVTEDQSSGVFPLGTTVVHVMATDAAGNLSQGSFTITVQDTTPPLINTPANLVVEANTPGGAEVNLPQATATDAIDPAPAVAEDHSSGFFPLGVTAVNVTATDLAGNVSQSSFTITVVAAVPPTIDTPANLVVEANTTGGAEVILPQATATDPADPNPVVAEDHSSGFFPLGTTAVNITATDFLGNQSTSSFTVTVQDTTPPTINTPANLVVEADASGGAQVTLPQATATDTFDPNPVVSEDHSSGFFPLGTTTVNVSASDASDNQSTSSFTVTVVDTTPPTITLPANLTVEANTIGGAQVTLPTPTATDISDPDPTVTQDQSSGFFPLGTTTVDVTATDASGNAATGAYTVTVVDSTPPTLALPANIVVEATQAGGAQVTLPTATATDITDPSPLVTEDHSSGFFPIGTTTVTVTAGDDSGNSSDGAFTVTVQDTTPPLLTAPANIVVDANSPQGASVTEATITAVSLADPSPVVTQVPPSGIFSIGTTTVNLTATDQYGETSSTSYNVTVTDNTAPSISVPANEVYEANAAGGANIPSLGVTATDPVDPSPVLAFNHTGSFFPLGTTQVIATATDSAGNTSSTLFTVTVEDTTPPSLTLPAAMVVTANRPGGATVTLLPATATDAADPNPLITYDHTSGLFPVGTTIVNVTATDASGNASSGTFDVTVQAPSPVLPNLPNITLAASGPAGATATYTGTATDVADRRRFPSPSRCPAARCFPSHTEVTATATDAAGNISSTRLYRDGYGHRHAHHFAIAQHNAFRQRSQRRGGDLRGHGLRFGLRYDPVELFSTQRLDFRPGHDDRYGHGHGRSGQYGQHLVQGGRREQLRTRFAHDGADHPGSHRSQRDRRNLFGHRPGRSRWNGPRTVLSGQRFGIPSWQDHLSRSRQRTRQGTRPLHRLW